MLISHIMDLRLQVYDVVSVTRMFFVIHSFRHMENENTWTAQTSAKATSTEANPYYSSK